MNQTTHVDSQTWDEKPEDKSAPSSSHCSAARECVSVGQLRTALDFATDECELTKPVEVQYTHDGDEVRMRIAAANPFDDLSHHALLFLSERCDFSSPWVGFGFPEQVEARIREALSRKEVSQ